VADKRVHVWVQEFKDRGNLVLQWFDPDTGKRKSRSAKTADPDKAEAARLDLEADLNNGRYPETSRMTWERFREVFEAEDVAPLRENTWLNYAYALNRGGRVVPGALSELPEQVLQLVVGGGQFRLGPLPERPRVQGVDGHVPEQPGRRPRGRPAAPPPPAPRCSGPARWSWPPPLAEAVEGPQQAQLAAGEVGEGCK
jgi:hypothetical protein